MADHHGPPPPPTKPTSRSIEILIHSSRHPRYRRCTSNTIPATLPRISIAPRAGGTAYIVSKLVLPLAPPADLATLRRRLAYVVSWKDLPSTRFIVRAENILDYVSPRALEDYEHEEWMADERKEEAEKAVQLAAAAPQKAATNARAPKRKGQPPRNTMKKVLPPPESPPRRATQPTGPSLSTPRKVDLARLKAVEAEVLEEMEELELMDDMSEDALNVNKDKVASNKTAMDIEEQAISTGREEEYKEGPPRKKARSTRSSRDLSPQGGSGRSRKSSPFVNPYSAAMDASKRSGQPALPPSQQSTPTAITAWERLPTTPASISTPSFSPLQSPLPALAKSPLPMNPQSKSSPEGKGSILNALHRAQGRSVSVVPLPLQKYFPKPTTQERHSYKPSASQIPLPEQRKQALGPLVAEQPKRMQPEVSSTPAPTPALPAPSLLAKQRANGSSALASASASPSVSPKPSSHGFTPAAASPSVRSQLMSLGVDNIVVTTAKTKSSMSEFMTRYPRPVKDPAGDDGAAGPEGEAQYEVKRLEGDSVVDGVRYFLVRWEGDWPPDENPTWEPEENISVKLVRAYLKRKKAKAEKQKLKDMRQDAGIGGNGTPKQHENRRGGKGGLRQIKLSFDNASAKKYASVSEAFADVEVEEEESGDMLMGPEDGGGRRQGEEWKREEESGNELVVTEDKDNGKGSLSISAMDIDLEVREHLRLFHRDRGG